MQKIDRLGWAAGFVYSAYGLRVGVRVTDPDVMGRVMGVLPPRWKPASGSTVDLLYSVVVGENRPGSRQRNYHLLYENISQMLRTFDLDSVIETLESLMRSAIATATHRWVFIHAGAVAWEGRAIVLPGRSTAGKSTLVETLVRRGATYLSDEYALFDRQGRVHSFPYPLRLLPGTPQARTKIARHINGRSVHSRPLPLGLVVVTEYQPEIRVWRPRKLSEGRTLMALIEGSPAIRIRPQLVIPTLTRAITGVPAYSGARGDADAAAERILGMMDRLYRVEHGNGNQSDANDDEDAGEAAEAPAGR